MTDGQDKVRFRVPCRFVDFKGDEKECDLDLEDAKVRLKGNRLERLLRRMEEAKRRRCGEFEIVLAFPAHQVPILKFMKGRNSRYASRYSSSGSSEASSSPSSSS